MTKLARFCEMIVMNPGKDFIGVGCGAIVINDKNEVLLVKRSMSSRTEPGFWSRPGGEVEFGERVEDAVVREVKEETGIDVEILGFLKVTQNLNKGEKKHWIALGYLARPLRGVAKNMEPKKHDAVEWFSIDALPERLTDYTKNTISVYLKQK